MGERRKAREWALQALYISDVSHLPLEKAYAGVTYRAQMVQKTFEFSKNLTFGVAEKKERLDGLITKVAKNWEIERMAALDRNILRLGAYELLFEKETPVSVILDEAVELAKLYSTPDSGKFVNGILDKIKPERDVPPLPNDGKNQNIETTR